MDAVADFRREPGVSVAAEAIEKEEFSGILFYVLKFSKLTNSVRARVSDIVSISRTLSLPPLTAWV